jgi:glycosyltransferase involved in cell wall biosynthesis
MKILLVSDTYPPDVNGAAYFTYRLASALTRQGHDVQVIAPGLAWRDSSSVERGVLVHRVRSLPTPGRAYFRFAPPWAARARVNALVAEIAPDVIHVQNHFLLGRAAISLAKKQGIPLVGTNHFMPDNLIPALHLPVVLEQRVKIWAWKQFSRVYQPVDCVTTPTKTAAALLRQVGFQKEVRAISCGIDLEKFHPRNQDLILKRTFNLPDDRPILLFVGRLDAEKRLLVVLRAFALVCEKQKTHLLLVGKGVQRAELEQEAKQLNISSHVTFTDFVSDEDLPRIFSVADVFVMASVAELQSIATMEAMASGLPVVAANILALPELVHDGENGFLFPPDNVPELARCLLNILSNPLQKMAMGKASLAIIQAHRSDATTQAFEEVYRLAIGMHAKR